MEAEALRHQAQSTRMASLLETGKYSDLTLTCRGREFAVHRSVLCPASKFFAAACDGGFMEAREGRINLDDDDPGALERMLSYLYTTHYDDRGPPSETQTPSSAMDTREEPGDGQSNVRGNVDNRTSILNNVSVYALAEKYDIEDLKDLAKETFGYRLTLQKWAHEDLFTVLEVVYRTTPFSDRGLRDIISVVCAYEIDDTRADLRKSPRFQEVMSRDATMAFDVLVRADDIRRSLRRKVENLENQLQEQAIEVQAGQKHIKTLEERLEEAEVDKKDTIDFVTDGGKCGRFRPLTHPDPDKDAET
ncbi:MAG: hypothetical protein Q9208_000637 [Pyrenodesmia sp. 3 TL-2023]